MNFLIFLCRMFLVEFLEIRTRENTLKIRGKQDSIDRGSSVIVKYLFV